MSVLPAGHLYVIDGDLQKVAVNAWLLPLDGFFSYTHIWTDTLSKTSFLTDKIKPWQDGELVRFLAKVDGSDVWIGKVGTSDPDPDHYAQCAIQFIDKASERIRESLSNARLKPLLAINHLGTGRGGAQTAHGEVLGHLMQRVTEHISHRTHVDVALVSWGEKPTAAAQRIRFLRNAGDWRNDPQWAFPHNQDRVHDAAEKLAANMRDQSCSIFLGAGVSTGAGLLGWDQLLMEIGASTNPPTSPEELSTLSDPRDKAALLQNRLTNQGRSLGKELQSMLGAAKYSLQHGLIASLPGGEFITTNVDELFEAACSTNKRSISVIPNEPAGSGRWLLKLHGTISNPDSLIFTRDHYLSAGRNSRALMGLVQAMLFTRHMFFVGYGLRDEDFHELVYEVRSAFPAGKLSEQLGTALALFEDPIQIELWNEVLEVVALRPPLNGALLTSELMASAARDAQRFLDLVGMLASGRSAFLLDENYAGMRTESENSAHQTLLDTVLQARRHTDDEPGWREIRELLLKLGAKLNINEE